MDTDEPPPLAEPEDKPPPLVADDKMEIEKEEKEVEE